MTIYEVRVVTGKGEILSRELKAESPEHAEQLARLKFENLESVAIVSSREQTPEEVAEEERLRAQSNRPLPSRRSRPVDISRLRIGTLLLAVGLIGSAISYLVAPGATRPYYVLVAAMVAGGALILWGLTGASRARSRRHHHAHNRELER